MKKYCLVFAMMISPMITSAEGDPEAGKNKSAVCAACHNVDGNSSITINPKIAGQHEGYLLKQLKEFKLASETAGKEGRNNAIMNGQAALLSEQDMKDLSAYFASQTLTVGETSEDVVEQGEALYRGGDAERGIAACIACHGPNGQGTSLSGFPVIGGQHADYTKTQLEMFRSEQRNNDLNGMMRDIAAKLTDEDIAILSEYLEGLY